MEEIIIWSGNSSCFILFWNLPHVKLEGVLSQITQTCYSCDVSRVVQTKSKNRVSIPFETKFGL